MSSNALDEGDWTTWDNWGACSGTCNADMRLRNMLFSGNRPCTGISDETGPCECELRMINLKGLLKLSASVISVEGAWDGGWGSWGACSNSNYYL